MLSADLRTLGDQLHGRGVAAVAIEPCEVEAIVACLRDLARRAQAIEALPADIVVDLDSRRPIVDAQGHYDGGRAWSRLGAKCRDEVGGLAIELILAGLGRQIAVSCVDRVPYSAAHRALEGRLISLLAHVLPPDIAGGVLPPLPARGVLPPRPDHDQAQEAAE